MASCSKTSNRTLAVVTMLVLLSLYATNCVAIKIRTELTRVHIKNALATSGPAQDLTVSCKSKDDELGTHVIAPWGSWDFKFHPNFWPSTLFFCRFSWPSLGTEIKWFDIYDQVRDERHCFDCCWTIIPNGACRCKCSGPCDYLDNCYGWNPVSPPPPPRP